MNQQHRIVWSESRQAFIVAGENAAARGKPCSTRGGAGRALIAALVMLGGGQALATNLIFDASQPTITTALTADTSFWVGVNNPGVNVAIGVGGSVVVNAGGNSATVGLNASSDGNTLDVSGAGATLTVAETVYSGYAGANNTLTVGTGGTVSALDLWIGGVAGSTGNALTVTGTGMASATASVILGYGAGGNALNVQSGGKVTSASASVGFVAGAPGNIAQVTGANSLWTSTGHFFFGNASSGNQLTVSNSGKVAVDGAAFDALVGATVGADNNQVLVTGGGSVLSNANGTLYVGRGGNGNSLQIKSGGLVTSKNVRIGGGTGATGTPTGNGVVVDGAGSTWNIGGTLRVGAGVAGTNSGLDVTGAGVVTVTGNSFVGYDATSDGNHVLVSGAGSQLNLQALAIGNAPGSIDNVVTLANGGVLSAASIALGESSGLVIGAGAASGSIAIPVVITGGGTGAYVRFNHSDSGYAFGSSLAGTLAVTHDGTGTTNLAGTNSYTGATTVNAGVLNINSVSATSAIAVNAGGTLGVFAGSTGTTTGNYTQAATGTFRTWIANNTTYGKLVANGTVGLTGSARIDVQVASCAAVTPGTVFPGVISSGSAIAVSSFAVSSNCPGLDFIARLNGSGNAIDLVLNAQRSIPTLSAWGMIALSGMLGLGAMAALRRRPERVRARTLAGR